MSLERMSKQLRKQKVEFICKHLQKADLEIMEAFVVKEAERVEYHLVCYLTRQELWKYLKSNKFNSILKFYLVTFCDLFIKHSSGGERFSRLLASWYQKTGTLACESLQTSETKRLWLTAISEFNGEISSLDRSAILSAIASTSYTFFQQQVR